MNRAHTNRLFARLVVFVALVSLVSVVAFYSCERRSGGAISPRSSTSNSTSQRSPNPFGTPSSSARRAYPSGWVDWKAFERRFQLTEVDVFKLRSALGHVVRDFVERRGAIAQVNRSDGDYFTVTLPELPLTDEQVQQNLLQVAIRVIGESKAIEVFADPEGFSAIARHTSLADLLIPRQFAFRRATPEGIQDPTKRPSYALFEIAISTYDVERHEMVLRNTHSGFRYTDADSIGLGWNAMAKAPQGYFRVAPIQGAASKPRPMPVVIREVGSEIFEVLNERGPGLSETITVPRKP